MSAEAAVQLARKHGIRLSVNGANLKVVSDKEPPTEVLEAIRGHKAEILALLAASKEGWSADEWRAFCDERVGIAEFDGGLPRAEAEANAFESCVIEWMKRNPAPSEPGRCAWCGAFETVGCSVIVPFGSDGSTKAGSHTWLHHACWSPWRHVRRMRAIEALRLVGITSSGQS